MLDLELLKTLVCVVDERSFTRAAERVHRTQSTVSQQINKLEESVGRALLVRDRTGKRVSPTEHGEILAAYARRLLAIAQEAEDVLSAPTALTPVRVGVPEDFNAQRMSAMLSDFLAIHPGVRLETVSGMSTDLSHKLHLGEIDIALIKREPGSGECIASWPESLVWVAGKAALQNEDEVPLAVFPQGCVYRQRAIRALDKIGKRWRVVFGSHSLTGIQAAVASGLGITVLPTTAVLPEHRALREDEGFPVLAPTELALISSPMPLNTAQRHLIGFLADSIGK
ncbi:transcriptional regulator, LysR family [Polaromonas sp. YR568]|uniref:LysR family transcriptional regulator n=1 Tax=Polaromonas sp. YR568 TaxID=1855301 RepID=UPI0008E5EFB9|nr:LysR family transcriptional regulator [Polaromonas sp. YR568]SFU54874.1 transcriptional regulator, LysR family [Polaromonas sp. YR568]